MNRTTMMILTALFTFAIAPALSFADAVIQARSDVPARVYFDGRVMGTTPIDIVAPHRGQHEVRFRAFGTHLEQSFVVNVPRRSTVVTPVFARLALSGGHCTPGTPVVVATPVVVQQPIFVASRSHRRSHRSGFWR